jgi:hypothetical protein
MIGLQPRESRPGSPMVLRNRVVTEQRLATATRSWLHDLKPPHFRRKPPADRGNFRVGCGIR